MVKSISAVLTGIIVIVILSVVTDMILESLGVFTPATQPELFTPWMAAMALLYRTIYAVVGGYVTAQIAPGNKMKHVIVLLSIGMVLGILGAIANWGKVSPGTAWYPIALVFTSAFGVWLGGKMEIKKK